MLIPHNKETCVYVFVCVLPRLIPTVAIGLSCGSPDNGPKMSALPRSSRILLCLEEESGERDFVRLLRDSLLLCVKETSGECDFIGLLLESCLQEKERVGEERSACVCLHGWMCHTWALCCVVGAFLYCFFVGIHSSIISFSIFAFLFKIRKFLCVCDRYTRMILRIRTCAFVHACEVSAAKICLCEEILVVEACQSLCVGSHKWNEWMKERRQGPTLWKGSLPTMSLHSWAKIRNIDMRWGGLWKKW